MTVPVTVVIPAHNSEKTLAATVQSVLNQTYSNFQIWILENGSTDRTLEIAKSFSDRRIKIIQLDHVGQSKAIQYALENVKSEWIARVDHDDLMFPDRLKAQMEIVHQVENMVMIGTAFVQLSPYGHIFERIQSRTGLREVDKALLVSGKFFGESTLTFNRQAALKAGGVDTEFEFADAAFSFRMLSVGRIFEMAEPLQIHRLIPTSASANQERFLIEGLRVRQKYAPEYFDQFPKAAHRKWFWIHVAYLESIAHESGLVRRAAKELWNCRFKRDAALIHSLSYFSKVLEFYFSRFRRKYRRRIDLESQFLELINNR